MEQLKYIIEDSTIAELLGNQNFTNEESAVLELVKNAYDAKACLITLSLKKINLSLKMMVLEWMNLILNDIGCILGKVIKNIK